jgi:hypothetical protein
MSLDIRPRVSAWFITAVGFAIMAAMKSKQIIGRSSDAKHCHYDAFVQL